LFYVGGSILLITLARYFIPLVPILLIWIGLSFSKFITIKVATSP
jgi:hypothetical protein